MNPTPSPLSLGASQADDDELARAELYGLLARLWIAPPDAELLERLASAGADAPQPGGLLEAAWQSLLNAVRSTDAGRAAAEFDALFAGVGKSEILPYGSYHLSGYLHEQPLARLRTDLAALGLARDNTRAETEDHVAYVFEVMRWLIAGDDEAVCVLEQQRRFFRDHVQSWVDRLCEAVEAHPRALLWRSIAAFTACFVAIEAQAFDMLEASGEHP